MHKAEQILANFTNKLVTGLPTVDVDRELPYDIEASETDAIRVFMGADEIIQDNLTYVDSELTIECELYVVRPTTTEYISTALNALRASVIQTIQPQSESAKNATLDVDGCISIFEGDFIPSDPEAGSRPRGLARLNFGVRYRRDIDNPETKT